MHHLRTSLVLSLIATGCAGCEADDYKDKKPDAGVTAEGLEAPMIETLPMMTPNDTIAIRGTTNGLRVISKGGPGEPVLKPVLPTGGFCLDVPINDTGPTLINTFALRDGLISPATTIEVTRDPAAPIPSNAKCLGQEMPVCVAEDTASSNCANDKDEDCDGFTDECDPGCNGCVEDGFGPNWEPFYVPMVAPGVYANLQLCPCRVDWYAFQAVMGRAVHVKATFTQTEIDIDMILQAPAAAQDGSTVSLASSKTTTSIEEINWVATGSGIVYLKVYPYRDGATDKYTLQVY
jgi:hypothetical protein